jgi:hypothetical protein
MTLEEYRNKYPQDAAVGWDYINQALEKVYGTTEPRHYAPPLHYMVGGNDPIDGTSIFDSGQQEPHLHLVSYGMSELYYNEESLGKAFSKWGFELTMRLKPYAPDEGDPMWAIEMMNNLARYVFESGNWFEENQFIPANGPIRLGTDTDITGLVLTLDPELGKIQTPHGEVSFLQLVGITSCELERLQANPSKTETEKFIQELKLKNPMLVTDLERRS